MENLILCLDLSTTSTGWAVIERDTKKLIKFGFIKGSNAGLSKLVYPKKQLYKMRKMVGEILSVVSSLGDSVTNIIIEEVNLHKSRLTGKTLDGLHWLLINSMGEEQLNKVIFMDSDGPTGWRTRLNLRMTDADRKLNRERKAMNKKIPKGSTKLPIINKKHLAARYVNGYYKMQFDVDKNPNDNDVVDAIGIGLSYLIDK